MRIQASAKRGGDVRDSVNRITLTAEIEHDREFLTSIYRILADPDNERQEEGVATMRRFLSEFPEESK